MIGTEDEVRSRLEGNEGAELACDTTNPLGTLLIRFDKDPDGTWNRLGLSPLRDAMYTNRWGQPALEQAAGKFLSGKYQSGEPICQYTAFRIWNGYLKAREKRRREIACEEFITEMARLTAAFRIENAREYDPESGTPGRLDTRSLYYRRTPAEHTRLDLWFPDSSRRLECVAAYDSFLPLITYYLNRLSDWGLYFRQCKVCGKFFLAKSFRYELCSDKCRKKQAPRINGSLTSGPGRMITTTSTRTNARAGVMSSTKRRKRPISRPTVWPECRMPLRVSRRRHCGGRPWSKAENPVLKNFGTGS